MTNDKGVGNFLFTSVAFYNIFARACAEIKIDLRLQAFCFFFKFSFALFPFSPFLLFLLHLLTFSWACFPFKNVQEKIIEVGNLITFAMEQPHVVAGNFCSEFFTQISEHFHAYKCRLHYAHHYNLGIIGKIFSSCRS